MSEIDDIWYVRLPNGQVLRASSTRSIRDSLHAGDLPPNCQVRRSQEDDWLAIEWVQEFADVVRKRPPNGDPSPRRALRATAAPTSINLEASSVAARLDPNRLPSAGVRGMFTELLAALDRTLVWDRLSLGMGFGLLAGLIGVAGGWLVQQGVMTWAVASGVGVLWLLLGALTAALLTQSIYFELSRMQAVRWSEITRGVGLLTLRVFFLFLLVGGATLAAIAGLRVLPAWLPRVLSPGLAAGVRDTLLAVVGMASLLGELLLWPLLAVTLLLPAVLVAEECGPLTALGHWFRLLGKHQTRVWMYEALALGLGLPVALALALPLILAAAGEGRLEGVPGTVVTLLAGMVAGGGFAYLVVANVFVYLNLRYATVQELRRS